MLTMKVVIASIVAALVASTASALDGHSGSAASDIATISGTSTGLRGRRELVHKPIVDEIGSEIANEDLFVAENKSNNDEARNLLLLKSKLLRKKRAIKKNRYGRRSKRVSGSIVGKKKVLGGPIYTKKKVLGGIIHKKKKVLGGIIGAKKKILGSIIGKKTGKYEPEPYHL